MARVGILLKTKKARRRNHCGNALLHIIYLCPRKK